MRVASSHLCFVVLAFLQVIAAAQAKNVLQTTVSQVELVPGTGTDGEALGRLPIALKPRGPSVVLYVHARLDSTNLRIRVVDASGKTLAEDDDSGGGTIPFARLEFDKATEVQIHVYASGLAKPVECTVHVVQAHETTATLAAAAAATTRIEEAKKAHEDGHLDRAREIVKELLAPLLAQEGAGESPAVVDALARVSRLASTAELLQIQRAVVGVVLELREKVLPAEHPDLQRAQLSYASIIFRLGDTLAAKTRYEHLLEVKRRMLSADHADLLAIEEMIASTLVILGNLEGAKEIQERILEIKERTLPDDDAGLQISRGELARTNEALGDLRSAMSLYKKALEVSERTLSEEDRSLQILRLNYGGALYSVGDIKGAAELFGKIVKAFERNLPPDHLDLQAAKRNYATTLAQLGEFAAARKIEKEVLDVLERTLPSDHPDLQGARQNYALTIKNFGDLEGAREIELKVLAVQERRNLPEDHPDLILARQNYAGTLFILGDLEGAREIQERVLAALSKKLPNDHLDLHLARLGFASTLFAQGKTGVAKSLLDETIAILGRSVPETHQLLQKARLNYATMLLELGDLQGARKIFERVIKIWKRIYPEGYPELQIAHQNLAIALIGLEDFAGAQVILQEVLVVQERNLPEGHPDLLRARMNYTTVLQAIGDLAGARSLIEQCIEVMAKTQPESHLSLLGARMNLAGIQSQLGELALARDGLANVLNIAERALPDGHSVIQSARHGLAGALVLLDDTSGKLGALLLDVSKGVLHQQESIRALLSFRQSAALADRSHQDITTLLQYSDFADAKARVVLDRATLSAIETTRCAESAMRRLSRLTLRPGSEAETQADSLRREIATASDSIAQHVQDAESIEALGEFIRAKEEAERKLVSLLSQQPGAKPCLESTTAEGIVRAIPPGAAAVGYWTYFKSEIKEVEGRRTLAMPIRMYVAFVVRDDGTVTRVDLGAAEPIERRVKAWRALVQSSAGADDAALLAQAQALRAAVLDPVLAAAGKVERLFVALDEALHLVPLDSLPQADEGGGLVGDVVEICGVTALRDLLLLEGDPALAPPSLVAVGAIDYGSAQASAPAPSLAAATYDPDGAPRDAMRGQSFEPIPATAGEVEAIVSTYGKTFTDGQSAKVLTGSDASRAAFVAAARGARYLHLATHAWFAPEDVVSSGDRTRASASAPLAAPSGSRELTVRGFAPMLLCGVALAGAGAKHEGATNPGILTAQEISTLDLSGCELAVFSACETSVGTRHAGQGVASLQQALHAAGVRLSLTSLWKVPDVATRQLMEAFYHRLWTDGTSPQRALWEAKRTLREAKGADGKPLYTPRDWAGWVLSGVRGPVEK